MNDVEELSPADERAAILKAEGARYEAKRNVIIRIGLVCAIFFGLLTAVQFVRDSPRSPNFNSFIIIVVAIASGAFNALTVWGATVLWTIFIAPRTWIMFSARGKSWRERSGLARSNVAGLRIMAFLTGSTLTMIIARLVYIQVAGLLAFIKEPRV